MGVRDENRERMEAAIRAAAREQIRTVGGAALSMRAIAREVGLVSSAIYRYHPTREALLTALVMESYTSLGDALADAAPAGAPPADRWRALARAFRAWATGRPHEFQLIYGTPIPGYAAPSDTIPLAARVAMPFLEAGAEGDRLAPPERLAAQLEGVGGGPAAAPLLALAELAGLLTLEFGGHLTGVADPADAYAYAVEDQVRRLGLS